MKPVFLFLLAATFASAQTAQEIMAKVAESQNHAEASRAAWVYQQDILVRLLRSGGKLAREENRQYTVTPGPNGVEREMAHFSGKYFANRKETAFAEPGEHYRGIDLDADIAKGLAENFGGEEDSRDGVNRDLFPLTARKQQGYIFKLMGSESWHGHNVFRIAFEPRPHREMVDGEDAGSWAGEALVDKTDLAPVMITTHMAHGVPLVVKTLLGTNIQQLGFKLTYEKFGDNLWFPVTYSGELKLRALFLYGRTISLSVANSGFRKADVKTEITFEK